MEKKKHIYTEQEAYQKLSALCALSEQCCHDVMKKMKRWEVADEVAERIVARLVKEKFIDEERFARAFVKDKFRYNHWGQVRIEQELKMRKIAPKHIEMGLEELQEEDSLGALREMIQKKRPTVKGKNEYEIRGKLIRFAMGRGFAMDDIMKVVGSLDDCDEYMD
jgi:regulatory protein